MSERYKQVKLYDNFSFCPTCPVDILKGAIYIDTITDKAVFQLKFVNIQKKDVKALYVQIKGSNDLGQEIENKEYQYLDMNISQGKEFGTEQLNELSDNTIRNIQITITKVIYSNNEIWENNNTASYDREPLDCIDKELLPIANKKAKKYGLKQDNIYYPIQNDEYWTCVCGTYNANSNEECYRCGCNKDFLFKEFSKDNLKRDLENHNKDIQAKNGNKKRIYEKTSKIFIILLILISVAGIFIYNILKTSCTVSLHTNLSYEQKQNIKTKIEEICKTTDVQYTSKEEALKEMKKIWGRKLLGDDVYDGKAENPFPDIYTVKVKLSQSSQLAKKLSNITGVKKVIENGKTIKKIMRLVIFTTIGILLFCIIVVRVRICMINRKIKS